MSSLSTFHRKIFPLALLPVMLITVFLISGCQKKGRDAGKEAVSADQAATAGQAVSVAVFIPGFVEGSPNYEMLVQGSREAVEETDGATLKVVEAGFNMAEWEEKLTSLAAFGGHDIIVNSNPAMPAICAAVAEKYPEQRFIVIDGYLRDHPQIHTVIFNQVEQGFLVGYMAGLVTTSQMAGANPDLKVGLVVGQQYPVMDQAIRPGFEKGLQAVNPGIKVDFRVVGNWYDAAKAANLAESMFDTGVDAILVIAGGAAQGVLKTAKSRGRYVLWFDSNGYALEPGSVVGSSVIHLAKATYESLLKAFAGELEYGTPRKLGVRDGYVEFITEDENFRNSVPRETRREMERIMKDFRAGNLELPMPDF